MFSRFIISTTHPIPENTVAPHNGSEIAEGAEQTILHLGDACRPYDRYKNESVRPPASASPDTTQHLHSDSRHTNTRSLCKPSVIGTTLLLPDPRAQQPQSLLRRPTRQRLPDTSSNYATKSIIHIPHIYYNYHKPASSQTPIFSRIQTQYSHSTRRAPPLRKLSDRRNKQTCTQLPRQPNPYPSPPPSPRPVPQPPPGRPNRQLP